MRARLSYVFPAYVLSYVLLIVLLFSAVLLVGYEVPQAARNNGNFILYLIGAWINHIVQWLSFVLAVILSLLITYVKLVPTDAEMASEYNKRRYQETIEQKRWVSCHDIISRI
jgi:hypothetical protein